MLALKSCLCVMMAFMCPAKRLSQLHLKQMPVDPFPTSFHLNLSFDNGKSV